nr:MAG: hypothetical protein [Microvirus sp.]
MTMLDMLPLVRIVPVDITKENIKEAIKEPLYLLIKDRLFRVVEIPNS